MFLHITNQSKCGHGHEQLLGLHPAVNSSKKVTMSTTHVVRHLLAVSGDHVNKLTFYRARLRFVSHNRLAAYSRLLLKISTIHVCKRLATVYRFSVNVYLHNELQKDVVIFNCLQLTGLDCRGGGRTEWRVMNSKTNVQQ